MQNRQGVQRVMTDKWTIQDGTFCAERRNGSRRNSK